MARMMRNTICPAIKSTDNHRLEPKDQPRAADGGIKAGANTKEDACNSDDCQREGHGQAKDMRLVQPAEGPAQRRPVVDVLQPRDNRDGDTEGDQGQKADGQAADGNAV